MATLDEQSTTLTEPPGEAVLVSQPVDGAGPGTFATDECTLELVARGCRDVLNGGTFELD